MDITPTITPVLDFSQIKKGAPQMANLLKTPTAGFTVGASYSALSNALQEAHAVRAAVEANKAKASDDTSGTTPGVVLQYNQYNNSPKALNTAEVYRSTKNQLSVAKGELEKK